MVGRWNTFNVEELHKKILSGRDLAAGALGGQVAEIEMIPRKKTTVEEVVAVTDMIQILIRNAIGAIADEAAVPLQVVAEATALEKMIADTHAAEPLIGRLHLSREGVVLYQRGAYLLSVIATLPRLVAPLNVAGLASLQLEGRFLRGC